MGNIQIGLDIATSVSVLIALIGSIITNLKTGKDLRKKNTAIILYDKLNVLFDFIRAQEKEYRVLNGEYLDNIRTEKDPNLIIQKYVTGMRLITSNILCELSAYKTTYKDLGIFGSDEFRKIYDKAKAVQEDCLNIGSKENNNKNGQFFLKCEKEVESLFNDLYVILNKMFILYVK